jgi:amidase
VWRGELSPRELVEAAIRRIERVDPTLGSVAVPRFEEALAEASEPLAQGPFRGVPFLMKDVGATQAGLPHYCGNRALRDADYRAPHTTYLGARFLKAGLVTLGKSKTPEFGLQSTTQPLAFGPCRNPWNPELSPGGSSGGAAAAVAAGLVPLAHANDGAGSIRIPAAWCGVVGLKPSRGRIALEQTHVGRHFVGFAITRSLRDTAALLDAVHGSESGDLFRLAPPARPFREELGGEIAGLRVGWLARMPGVAVDAGADRTVQRALSALAELGCTVEDSFPAALHEEEHTLLGLVFGPVEYRLALRSLARMLGRPVREDDIEPYLWKLADPEGPQVLAEDLVEAAEAEQAWAVRVSSWFASGFDLLVTPTLGELPAPLAELDGATHSPEQLLARMAPHMAFTHPFNVTGHPALSLPLGVSPEGLPVGVQLVARLGREDLLLRAGSALEAALPWSERRPALFA